MEVVGGDEVIGGDEDIDLDVLLHTLGPRSRRLSHKAWDDKGKAAVKRTHRSTYGFTWE